MSPIGRICPIGPMKSPETNTPSPRTSDRGEERVRAAWRHAETGRNDQSVEVVAKRFSLVAIRFFSNKSERSSLSGKLIARDAGDRDPMTSSNR